MEKRSTGLLAGGMLVTANLFVLSHNARSGDPDALFILLATSAVFAALQAKEHIRWLYLSCFLLALGFLTKSFHVGPPMLTVMGLALWLRGREVFRLRVLCLCVLYGVVPVLLWAALRYSVDGTIFFEKMWYLDLYNRATTVVEGHLGSATYYLNVLKTNFRTPALILVAGFSLLMYYVLNKKYIVKTYLNTQHKRILLQLLFCAVLPFILFQFSSSKLRWYIYPISPFVALLLATALDTLFRNVWNILPDKRSRRILVCLIVLVCSFQEYRLISRILQYAREHAPVQHMLRELGRNTRGVPIYLEQAQWEQGNVLAAKIYGHFLPLDGGMEAWKKDKNNRAIILTADGQYLTKTQ